MGEGRRVIMNHIIKSYLNNGMGRGGREVREGIVGGLGSVLNK
jgi:hypothetical protein